MSEEDKKLDTELENSSISGGRDFVGKTLNYYKKDVKRTAKSLINRKSASKKVNLEGVNNVSGGCGHHCGGHHGHRFGPPHGHPGGGFPGAHGRFPHLGGPQNTQPPPADGFINGPVEGIAGGNGGGQHSELPSPPPGDSSSNTGAPV